jgi:hypothetical protein
MRKSIHLGTRLDPDTRQTLEHAAVSDHRTLSSLASKILTEWAMAYAAAHGPPTQKKDMENIQC